MIGAGISRQVRPRCGAGDILGQVQRRGLNTGLLIQARAVLREA